MTDTRKAQLEISADATGAERAFDNVKKAGRDMAQAVGQSAQAAGKSMDGLGTSADAGVQKFDRSTSGIIASVQRATAALQAGEKGTAKYFEALAEQRGANLDILRPYIEELKRVEAAQNKAAISTGQMNAALRGVPAQMTDIVTSLASGQAPMTVLLQQGGQLKDMFGGVGAAARALGGYIVSLVNPFTAAAAAAGVLGYAAYQGSKETSEYAKAIILSGNVAGATVGQLQLMAQAMSATGMTQGAAAQALAVFAQSANVGRANLQDFTTAAIRMSAVTGQSVGEVAKQFSDLAKDPLQASLKLNESMNYLSMAVYQSIKALQEQGRTAEAAALAQKAFAEAGTEIGKNYQASLGTLERSWNAVTGAIKGAWDAVKGFGRQATAGPEVELAAIQSQIADRQESLRQYGNRGGVFGGTTEQQLAALREQESILQSQVREIRKAVDLKVQESAKVDARAQADKDALKYLTDQQRLERDIAQQTATLVTADASRAEIEQRIAAIKASYAKKGPAEKQEIDSTLASLQARVKEEERLIAVLTGQQDGRLKLSEAERQALKLQEELSGSMDKVARSSKERQLAELQALIPLEQRRILLETLRKEEEAQLKAINGSVDSTNERALSQEQANATFGMGHAALARLTLASLEQQRTDLEATENVIPGYTAALERRIEAQKRLVKAMEQGEAQQAKDKAAKEFAAEWKRYADEINRSLTDSLMRGFESGKGFAQSLKDAVVNMFKTMVLRPVVQFMVGGVAGALGLGPATAMAGQGGLAQSAQLLSIGDTISKVYSSVTGSFAALGDKVAFAAQDIGAWLTANTTGVLNQAGTSIMQASGTLGTVAGYAGGALAGYGIGKAISGQYTTGLGKNTLEVGGTALGAILGGPLGAAIGGAIGGAINRAFGRGPMQTTGEGLRGTFSADTGASVQSYTSWYQSGGWFRSSRSGTNYSAISADLDQFLDAAVTMTAGATKEYARLLGLNTDAIAGFSKSIDISLRGLDAAGQEKAIADAIGGFGNSMAEVLLGDFRDVTTKVKRLWVESFNTTTEWVAGPYVREGEKASEALARLAQSLAGVNDVLKILGQTTLTASLGTADSASKLLDLFGGLQAYSQSAGQYLQAYYTDAERYNIAMRNMAQALSGMGLQLPSTTAQYRALVEAQDLTTDSGRKAYTAMMQLAPAFAEVSEYAKQVAQQRQGLQDQIDQLLGNTTALRERERMALDESNRALYDQVQAIKDQQSAAQQAADAAKNTTDAAYSTLQRSVDAQRKIIDTTRQLAQEQLNSVKGVFGVLESGIKNLLGSTAGDTQRANEFIDSALAAARATGYLPDQQALQDAISAATQGLNSGIYASAVDQQAARLQLAGRLGALKDISGDQLTAAEKQLQAAQDQLNNLDQILQSTKEQMDVLRGIDTGIKAIPVAIQALSAAMASERSTAVISARATGGYTPAGLTLVGEKGPELVNFSQPSMVYTSAQTQSLLSCGPRVEALIANLTAEVRRLQSIVNDGNREARRTADAVNGNPEQPMLVQTA